MINGKIDAEIEKNREANVIFEFARLLHINKIRFTLEKAFKIINPWNNRAEKLKPDMVIYGEDGTILAAVEFKGYKSSIPTEIGRYRRWKKTRQGSRYRREFSNAIYVCGPHTFQVAYRKILALAGAKK